MVINLCATRYLEDILTDLPYRFAVADKVSTDETLFIWRGGGGEDALEREPLNLDPVISAGTLQVLSIAGLDEQSTFVAFAEHLDDGEAATGAIAVQRGYSVATDDRKAVRLLSSANVRVYSTLQLIRQWCDTRGLSVQGIATVLTDIRVRGRFLPPRRDPLQTWWDAHRASII